MTTDMHTQTVVPIRSTPRTITFNCTSSDDCTDPNTSIAFPSYDAVLFVSAFALMLFVVVGCWSYHAGKSIQQLCLLCRSDTDSSWCSWLHYYMMRFFCCCCYGSPCCRCIKCCVDDEEYTIGEDGQKVRVDDREKHKRNKSISKPLSRLLRDSVRRVLYRQNACAICLDEFNNVKHTTIYQTSCKHFFHSACIRKWMKASSRNSLGSSDTARSCPVCRKNIIMTEGVHSKVTSRLHFIWSVEPPQQKKKEIIGEHPEEHTPNRTVATIENECNPNIPSTSTSIGNYDALETSDGEHSADPIVTPTSTSSSSSSESNSLNSSTHNHTEVDRSNTQQTHNETNHKRTSSGEIPTPIDCEKPLKVKDSTSDKTLAAYTNSALVLDDEESQDSQTTVSSISGVLPAPGLCTITEIVVISDPVEDQNQDEDLVENEAGYIERF